MAAKRILTDDQVSRPHLRRIRWQAGLLMTVLVLLLSVAGWFLSRQMEKMVRETLSDVEPNYRLYMLQDISRSLTRAENEVNVYSIAHRQESLVPYYHTVEQLETQLDSLYGMPVGPATVPIPSISRWIVELLDVWDEVIRLENDLDVEVAVDRLLSRLEERKSGEPEKKVNLFQRIFRKRKSEAESRESLAGEINALEKRTLADVKKLEEQRLVLQQQAEEIMGKIRAAITDAERLELQMVRNRARAAAENAETIRLYLKGLGGIAGAIFLVLLYTVISFLRKDRRYRLALERTTREAERLTQAKERFLAAVSHEIRTPLHALLGYLEQLRKNQTGTAKQWEGVNRASEHLSQVVEDVLDYARLSDGKITFRNLSFDPEQLFRETHEMLGDMARDKGLQYRLEWPENTRGIWLRGDPVRLRQILINLLSNAIKFTERGEVVLQLDITPEKDRRYRLQLTVCDTGIGIAPARQEAIFEDFTQAEETTGSFYGGTGLGLAITKQIVNAMGGSVSLDSARGQGTTVRVEITLPQGTPVEPAFIPEIPDWKGYRVLVVDDDRMNRQLLSVILGRWQMKVDTAENGMAAVERCKQQMFDLVLIDLNMPDMTGEETLRSITSVSDQTPLCVLMSAAATEKAIARYLSLGFHDILPKPFSEIQLQEKMNRWLQTSEKKESVQRVSVDMHLLEQMLGGDRQALLSMLRDLTHDLEKGWQEVTESDAGSERLAEWAHQMAPACRHIGAHALYSKLKLLERQSGEMDAVRYRREMENLDELIKGLLEALYEQIAALETEQKHGA